jgi:glycosyltransferase involved in cell wall biosynthesis
VRVLFLTNNPNLGSTARILQSWLLLGRRDGPAGRVVVQKPGDFARWLADQGFPHRIDPMPWPDRNWPVPSLWHAWRVARWARRVGVDVIHCNEHNVYPFALLLRRLLRRSLVCHVRFRVEREFCAWAFGGRRRPDALLWTSHQQREDCAAAVAGIVPPDRQHTVYLGLDLGTFGALAAGRAATRAAWGFAPDEIVIGTATALRPHKRVEDFIDMVAALAREDPRVVGVVAGDAPPGDEVYRDKIVRRIGETGLGRRLIWAGNLEPVEPFYHASDVFVSTSEYETFGNSVCEAMACGRPVAAYRGGSVHEVVGDVGRVVANGDVPALTAAVRELVGRPDLRAELGARGRQRVADEFDPAASLRRVRAIYAGLAHPGTRPGAMLSAAGAVTADD